MLKLHARELSYIDPACLSVGDVVRLRPMAEIYLIDRDFRHNPGGCYHGDDPEDEFPQDFTITSFSDECEENFGGTEVKHQFFRGTKIRNKFGQLMGGPHWIFTTAMLDPSCVLLDCGIPTTGSTSVSIVQEMEG